MQRIALIPSYEPDEKLEGIVKELVEEKFKVVVVNDGSSKDYEKYFDSIRKICHVIEYDVNQGKGHALKTGFEYIKETYKDYIVITMDSDGQHTVKDAKRLCEYTEQHPKELVIGKRIRSGKTPLRSKIGNGITKVVYYLTTGVNVYDTQTGLRCFTKELMDFSLGVKGERFEYEMNVLLEAPLEGITITEMEIETIYYNNNSGSHFKAFRDSFRIYKEILKFSLSSIISFIIDYIIYTIVLLLTASINVSNIVARIISATCNYTINKKFVFNSNRKVSSTLLEYALLAIFILIVNTLLLNILCIIGINAFIAKVLVEILLFTISWLIQKKKIFV
jgi:glycosyltransferase involved in cell wall biosynthesis